MHSVKLHPYILLGSSIRYLLDIQEGIQIIGKTQNKELPILTHLKRIETLLTSMGLNVTAQAFKGELGESIKLFEKLPEGSKISSQQANEILEHIKIIADVLKYEATNLHAYIIAERRLPVEKLLSNVDKLFGDNVFWALPELSKFDFTQAGKCIAFELPTSAAFHILRGTEGVLRSYFSELLKPPQSQNHLLWGGMIIDLRKITENPPPKELLDNLDNIRVSFRNPTQHPEKTYDIDEAQDLFNLSVDVVNRMAKDLFRRDIWSEIPF